MIKRPDWSQRLPRAIDVESHMQLATLSDVREFLLRLSADRQAHRQWQSVAAALLAAADASSIEEVAVALQLALQISGVPYASADK